MLICKNIIYKKNLGMKISVIKDFLKLEFGQLNIEKVFIAEAYLD